MPERQASAGETASSSIIGASGSVTITKENFVSAVSDELKDHFRWTSVEGLVELEAETIAQFAYARMPDGFD